MSSVNLFTREISIKIVYYGPGLGGKTSSLQYIHRALKSDSRGQLVSLATGVDRTLYFDFLPVKLPKLRGYSIRVQLYPVPGQVHYTSTRKLVLAGCDGVVFVADSQRDRDTANVESFENLRENLLEQGMRLDQVPHIVQFNKRDAPDVLPVAEMNGKLNPFSTPAFETVATSGRGVFEALKSITTLVLNDLRRRGIWDGGDGATKPGAPAAGAMDFSRTDSSIAQRIQALSEAADAVAKLEPPQGGRSTIQMFATNSATHGATNSGGVAVGAGGTPLPSLLPQPGHATTPAAIATGQSGSPNFLSPVGSNSGMTRLPVAAKVPQAAGLAELLPEGPARDQVLAVEAEIARGDYASAVRLAARAFAESAKAESTEAELAPVLHALMIGVGGKRYLRFCEAAQRAEQGTAASDDALFAAFFLADAALER